MDMGHIYLSMVVTRNIPGKRNWLYFGASLEEVAKGTHSCFT